MWTRDLHPPAPTPAGFSASSQATICLCHYVVSLWWVVILLLFIPMNINPASESIFVIFFGTARAQQHSGNVTMGGKDYIFMFYPILVVPELQTYYFSVIHFCLSVICYDMQTYGYVAYTANVHHSTVTVHVSFQPWGEKQRR